MTAPAWRAPLVAAAAAGASALALALYARVEWPWVVLVWVALVPWLAVLDRAPSLRAALAAGLLMCAAFVLLVFSWFPSAIQNYSGVPWMLSLLVVALLAPLIEPQFVTFALARHLARRSRTQSTQRGRFWRTALVGACVYVGTEWASPKLFADTLGHGLYASALMRQAADVAGAHGLTFVLLVANECVLAALHAVISDGRNAAGADARRHHLLRALAPAACAAALAAGLLSYGALRYRQLGGADHPADGVTAGVVQVDLSQYGRLAAELGTFEAVRRILDAHFALSAEALRRGNLDLLVWPETVYPTTFGAPKSEDGAAFDREIGAFAAATGVPLVFGAYDAEGGDEFNAAVFLEPAAAGRVTFETYRKRWLFPLIERVPAVFESEAVRYWLPWLGTWKPGTGPQVVALSLRDGRTVRIAPLICYDALAPGLAIAAVRQGAEIIVTLSNDSWFTFGNVPRLILVLSAFRSIETRRPQVRATNTGVSAVITATGELLHTIGVHQRATLIGTVAAERSAKTLMLAWGDWFGPSALACGVVLLAAPLTRSASRPRGHSKAVRAIMKRGKP